MATQDYVLNGTTTFTFPFAVRSASVLTLELVPGGVVSTGDYTVTGAGPTSTGVTVTYPNAPTSATTVLRITRYVQPDRATTLNGPSDVTVANLNAEFDNAYDAIADFQVAGVNIAQAVMDAQAAEAAAEAAQLAAEAAAAEVNLPSIVGGDAGKILRVNGAEDGYELAESDLPRIVGGDAGKILRVNGAEDGYELAESDLPSIVGGDAGKILRVNGAEGGYELTEINSALVPQWTSAVQIGTGLSIAGVDNPALATLNGTDVAFVDVGNDELRTYRWSGSAWSLVGTGLSIAGVGGNTSLAALNGTDVAFIDGNDDELRTYRFAFYIGTGPYRP